MSQTSKKFYYNKNFYLALGLIIVAGSLFLILLNLVIMPAYTHHDEGVTVPNVTRLSLKNAEKVLKSSGLKYEIADHRSSNAFPANHVIDQNPSADEIVKPHRKIYLTVNTVSHPTVKMPKITDLSLQNARIQLENAGLKIGTISLESGRFKNTVLHQSIKPDKTIKKGTRIDMVVSNGLGKKRVTVPEIVGLELTKAEQELRKSGLRIGQIKFKPMNKRTPNIVINYSPKVKKIIKGSSIKLIVSELPGNKKHSVSMPPMDSTSASAKGSGQQNK
ncbi:MAG TPA: PASTA domain-containing protein [Balneolaceae bacterium]|nr:PASTA domain-containing protein [Balneolaceae bacterium]